MDEVHTPLGTVQALFRFPVKSTAGEALDTVDITARGPAYDRGWAAYTADGSTASGKRTSRFRAVPGLMAWSSMIEHDDVPTLVSPHGRRYRVDAVEASAALSAELGQELRLRRESTTELYDESPLHLITTTSLDELGRLTGDTVDPRRFRANLVLALDDQLGLKDNDLIGRELAIGDHVALKIGEGMTRCTMVDQPQAGVSIDQKVLRTLGATSDTEFGLQARAVRFGTVRVGDYVTLRHPG